MSIPRRWTNWRPTREDFAGQAWDRKFILDIETAADSAAHGRELRPRMTDELEESIVRFLFWGDLFSNCRSCVNARAVLLARSRSDRIVRQDYDIARQAREQRCDSDGG
jgi:hypothetical protein